MAQGKLLNYIQSITLKNLKDAAGNLIDSANPNYSPFRVIEGASYTEGDVSHNYLEAETSNNPLFDSPTQDPAVFTFDVADMESELLSKVCGAIETTAGWVIPSIFPTIIADVEIKLKTDGNATAATNSTILLTECSIVAKQVGEDLKTSLWHASIECSVSGGKIINIYNN